MISVIICTYNRYRQLDLTLAGLQELNVPSDCEWELIVVDNNSRDCTREIVEKYVGVGKLPLSYQFEKNQGLSHARNCGIQRSTGDLVVFLDDDVRVSPNWLAEVHQSSKMKDAWVFGGKVLLEFEESPPLWLKEKYFGCFGSHDCGDEMTVIENEFGRTPGIGANLWFRRFVFDRVGMFDVSFGRKGNNLAMGEETDIIWRVMEQGGSCVYYPDALLYHRIGSEKVSKDYVRRWHFRMGQWDCHVLNRRNRGAGKVRIPLWMMKDLAVQASGYMVSLFSSNGPKRIEYELTMARYLGYCYCCVTGKV